MEEDVEVVEYRSTLKYFKVSNNLWKWGLNWIFLQYLPFHPNSDIFVWNNILNQHTHQHIHIKYK